MTDALLAMVSEEVFDAIKQFVQQEMKAGRAIAPWTYRELLEGARSMRPELSNAIESMLPAAHQCPKRYGPGPGLVETYTN